MDCLRGKPVLVGSGVSVSELTKAMTNTQVNHFLQSDREDFLYDLLTAAVFLNRSEEVLESPELLIHSRFKKKAIKSNEVRSLQIDFKRSEELPEKLKQAERFLGSSECSS